MRLLVCSALFALSVATAAAQAPAAAPYLNTKLTPEARAHDLVSRMTLEEKAEQSLNTAPAIPRLGVPAYDYWSEGLHGMARSGYATLFPQAIGMAATWNAPLVSKIGEVVSTEARAKFNDAVAHNVHSIYLGLTIWSPNINIFRDPRWGRGQETYGEDPFLTGQLGLNFIRGLQGPDPLHPRSVATPKHFAVHSGPENDRHRFNVEPSQHDLWDTYLPQFRTAIVEGKADSIMCAYNALYGKPACASDLLLGKILRDDWKFTGFVTSDCGAVDDFFEKTAHRYSKDAAHASAAGILVGTDTNCGTTYKTLPQAVKQGLVSEADIDRSIERLFVARIRLGLFDAPSSYAYGRIPYSEDRSPAHLAMARKASEEAMVLLKNDGILPLAPGRYKTIAVIGPNAASLAGLEGNYNAVPKDPQLPVDSFRKAFPASKILYSQGSSYADGAPLTVPSTVLHPSADSQVEGLKAEYFAGDETDVAKSFAKSPVTTRVDPIVDFDWNYAAPVAGLKPQKFAVRWSGVITPPSAGDYEFNMRLAHCYPCHDNEHFTVKIDGKQVDSYDVRDPEYRETTTPRFDVHFADTMPHAVVIEYTHDAPLYGAGLRFEWVPKPALMQDDAVTKAKQSDLIVAMMGLSPDLEGEELKVKLEGFDGGDRTDIKLPASQEKLLQALAATGKPMIVVLLNGSALAVNWANDHANAILDAWYPGEFGGAAIVDTLKGINNPAGRLPITFYRGVDELPSFSDYAMKNRTYRYFTGETLYRFGYGLSYTTFAYSPVKLSTKKLAAGNTLTAEVTVTNTGKRAGDEVAELYLMPPAGSNGGLSPKLALEGFQRVSLAPGAKKTLTFTLDPRQLSQVDAAGRISVQPGEYKLSIGGSQPDDANAKTKAQSATFEIEGSMALEH
ncbi:glycoside hydrolase family 3 C-terminal domain-containing protein [Granulicella cerasi]|uniref:Glycoside hydrolase family 3 C-terminal domain-containing protein n=1 Tax=Granulicella cerasi TaxID=741063 RepID=A0ABW1ZAP7_9BACT|nr:glycoside hydrolase family 3 C-terminal domain-containing protein [Granulicella cerasi]